MEFKADLLVNDCTYAIAKHNSNLQGVEFRISWWTIISMLRAIGHVLNNVDSELSEKHKKIITQAYNKLKSTKPKPELYWEFIEKERNKFLKEYAYGVRRQLTKKSFTDGTPSSVSLIVDELTDTTFRMQDSFPESFITDGYFKGISERQIAWDALCWWKIYIEDIKQKISEV